MIQYEKKDIPYNGPASFVQPGSKYGKRTASAGSIEEEDQFTRVGPSDGQPDTTPFPANRF
ncbi:MAG: hypothetical protein WCF67_18535 [Chitinophagaceae bacterium]